MALPDMISPISPDAYKNGRNPYISKQPRLKSAPPVSSTLENTPSKAASMATGAVGPGAIRWINRGAKPAAGPSLGTGGVSLDGGS
jgi:hypothetical protein